MESIDVTFIDDLEYASAQGAFKNRYGRVSIVGSGKYANVWKTIDFQTKSYCAVKDYSKDSFDVKQTGYIMDVYRFFQNIHHPNLLPVIDCFVENGAPYVVCPYHPKGSIESLIGKCSEHTLLHICLDVARGLEYMHSKKHLHMDVKPSNILQSDAGDFILSDFGISYAMKDIIRQFVPLKTKGTDAYMSPERFTIGGEITPSSDIWSLGVVLYEMATGRTPFGQYGGQALLTTTEDLAHLSLEESFSSKLNDLVLACLATEPQKRPTAGKIIKVVEELIIDNEQTNTVDVHCSIYGPPVEKEIFEYKRPIGYPVTPIPTVYGPPPAFRNPTFLERIKSSLKKEKH